MAGEGKEGSMGKTVMILLVLTLVAAGASSAPAADDKEIFELGPFVGGYVFDPDQELGNSALAGIRAGYSFNGGTCVMEEFLALVPVAKGLSGAGDNRFFLAGIELLYRFNPGGSLSPFLAGGLALAGYDPAVDGDNRRTLTCVGGGAAYCPGPGSVLRGDLRYIQNIKGLRRGNWMFALGWSWELGG
jgi:hypothetical protein